MRDLPEFREQFPVTREHCYLLSPAVTVLPSPTRDALSDFADDMVQNGCLNESNWVQETETTRRSLAQFLGTRPENLAFVPNTSAGLSLIAEGVPYRDEDRIAVPGGEFPSNVYPWLNQARHKDRPVDRIPLENGRLTATAINQTLTDQTRVLALSSVQFHNGYRFPLEELEPYRTQDRFVVVDGIQQIGWDPVNLDQAPIDALVADAHKWLCGPEGIGVMYLSHRLLEALRPILVGWKSVRDPFTFEEDFTLRDGADRLEPGSTNHLGIYALKASIDLLRSVDQATLRQHNLDLAEQAQDGLRDREFTVRRANWPEKHRSPIVAAEPPNGLSAERVQEKLAKYSVRVSARRGSIRAGFHGYNDESDVEQFLSCLDEVC